MNTFKGWVGKFHTSFFSHHHTIGLAETHTYILPSFTHTLIRTNTLTHTSWYVNYIFVNLSGFFLQQRMVLEDAKDTFEGWVGNAERIQLVKLSGILLT